MMQAANDVADLPTTLTSDQERALARCWFDLSDLGNAKRLVDQAGGMLRWLPDDKCWIAFDGRRWSIEEGEQRARAFTHAVAEGIRAERNALSSIKDDARQLSERFGAWCTPDLAQARVIALHGWASDSGNASRSNGMLAQAKGLAELNARMVDFDTDPYAYHVANGTIRFGQPDGPDGPWAWKFEPGHAAADMFTRQAAFIFDAGAACPHWEKRLIELHDDPAQRTAIQRIYGMGLTQLISDQAFYVYQGGGNDGKSMTNEVVGAGHGEAGEGGYFRQSAPQVFLESGSQKEASAHQSAVVRLAGDIRLVVCDEPPKRATWDGNRIKQVTGSKITARGHNAKTEITFTPHFQLIVECNGLPKMPGDDRGFRRRFKLYPWLKTYGKTQGLVDEDPAIVKARLLGELPGILNWMIAGAVDWLNERKIPEPMMAKRATESFWDDTSPMGSWLKDCCDLSDPDARVGATELYQHFRAYRIAAGDKEDRIMGQTSFGNRLNDLQIYGDKNGRGTIDRLGIRLLAPGEARVDDAPAEGSAAPSGYQGEVPGDENWRPFDDEL